ncbi:MAG TPA: glycosyltransferase family 87 protein [Acidimicrobiales bacterium]|nr:glycosyltransferase family 87 protein [Acidimicrobiales bacterium]
MPTDSDRKAVEPSGGPSFIAVIVRGWRSLLAPVRRWSPEWRDAALYGISGLFALFTATVAGIPLYRQWGLMAVGPYLVGGAFMAVLARRRGARHGESPVTARRYRIARITACAVVFAGATIVPLTMEVIWRAEGPAAEHVQPEVIVVERAGVAAASGHNPYRVVDTNGHILIHQDAVPVYELYYPYLPGMVLFGFSSGSKVEAQLTDARLQFLLFTVLVGGFALSRLKAPRDTRARALQVLAVLPTAALPLATGGDDMPVVALMLLGLVALQRRRPVLAGLALGAASSLKFTAWPLAFLALWAAQDLYRSRAIGRYVLGFVVIAGPVVAPFALRNPSAFVDNVIRFPLGLAGVASPAASPLPGHLLISAVPGVHRPYVIAAAVIGAVLLLWRLKVKPPKTAADVSELTGWVMLIALLVAPATRVGYLLYPANLFVWAYVLRRAAAPIDLAPRPPASPWTRLVAQVPGSATSNRRSVNGVTPAEVVGDTTTPASQ